MHQLEQCLLSMYNQIKVRASNEFKNSSQLLVQIRDIEYMEYLKFIFIGYFPAVGFVYSPDIGILYTYTE